MLVIAADVLVEIVMPPVVTVLTVVPEAKEDPLALIPTATPVVLVQVSDVEPLDAVHPVRLITGSVENAPVPLAMVGGVSAKAGDSSVMAAVARTPAANNKADTILKITAPWTRAGTPGLMTAPPLYPLLLACPLTLGCIPQPRMPLPNVLNVLNARSQEI